ncbi:MAG: protein-glutamate O-methyltransferase CheR [Flavobacteriia bacterium]|nr:protein-glutamate O-methyltransferase CheR [Flavobacteriia bacterium]
MSEKFLHIEKEEYNVLLHVLKQEFDYDFYEFSPNSFQRRILRFISKEKINVKSLINKLLSENGYLQYFINELTVNVTEFFRDPSMYFVLKNEIFPKWESFPTVHIWIAGCSTGEVVYSLAVLLYENNLLDKCVIYATDINQNNLNKVKEGKYPKALLSSYLNQHQYVTNTSNAHDYIQIDENTFTFNQNIKNKIIVAKHNLVNDESFNEFNLIICRNVFIYFEQKLQNRVLKLFHNSLKSNAYLILGKKENIDFSDCLPLYKTLHKKEKIYQKN